jgi:hypothetical protein
MSLFFNRDLIPAVDDAVAKYKVSEFKSPTRSTVPLLSWLKHDMQMVNSVLAALEMPGGYDLHLEYKIKNQKGKGPASQTDLMVLQSSNSLAIEVKWTEPRYDTVDVWLKKGENSQNRKDVLTGWLKALETYAHRPLCPADFANSVCQMVHRAASACVAGSNPKMAYLIFEPSLKPQSERIQKIRSDLTHLRSLLGNPVRFPFYLVEIALSPTLTYKPILSMPKNSSLTAKSVSDAILEGKRIFDFSGFHVTSIL